MEWRVQLSGDESDLEELSKSLNSDSTRIFKDKGSYVLCSSAFHGMMEAQVIKDKAENILSYINGCSRLIEDFQQPIIISGIQSLSENGRRNQYIFPESVAIEVRMGRPTVSVNGKVEESYTYEELSNYIPLAIQDQNVALVLYYLSTESNEIATLYKIYEIIDDDVGGERSIQNNGWTSRNQLERFRRTANSPDAIKDNARHGVQKYSPPKNPMSLDEARYLILHLVRCWLDSKIMAK